MQLGKRGHRTSVRSRGTTVGGRRRPAAAIVSRPEQVDGEERLPAHFSRVDEVAKRLRERILQDRLPAGSRLGTKGELARRYGVSLGTLNGALRVLAAQKIAESRPGVGGGVFVAKARPHLQLASVLLALREDSDLTLLTNVYAARTQLDVLLTRLAAESRTEDDVQALRTALAVMAEHPGELQWTWEFHDRIAQAAHSPILLAIYRRLRGLLEAEVADISGPGADRGDAATALAHLNRHRELAESIIAGAKERATVLAEEHGRRLRHEN